MQRIDPKMSKYAYARMLIIGDEPNLEIEGVWMFRGQEIPEIMNEHPQFEHFDKKKLDFMGNGADYELVGEFFGAPKEGGKAKGKNIQRNEWFM